jgi:hypothetical protein
MSFFMVVSWILAIPCGWRHPESPEGTFAPLNWVSET